MKKHIKMLVFCFVIGLIFFIGNVQKVKADRGVVTCFYGDGETYNNSNNQVEINIWISDHVFQPSEFTGRYTVKKFQGKSMTQVETFGKDNGRKQQEERIFATNQCPESVLVIKKNSWWIYSGTYEEMANQKKGEENNGAKKIELLKVLDNGDKQFSNIKNFNTAVNTYLNKSYSLIGIGGAATEYIPKSYSCKYSDNNNHNWTVNLSENYELDKYGDYNAYVVNGCPATVFKITKKGNENDPAYVFFGEGSVNNAFPDWPRLCTDYSDSFKCEYLTNTNKYGEYSKPIQEIPWDYDAEFYLSKTFSGVDYSNVLLLTADGTTNNLKNLKITMNRSDAGLASDVGTKTTFINQMVTNKNGPEYIGCYDKETAQKKGWQLLYDDGVTDYKYYCNFMSKDGFLGYEEIKGDYIYLREGDAARSHDITTIQGANNYFLTLCKDCKNDPNGYGCDSMNKAYDIINKHVFKCRNILGTGNATMKAECEKLMDVNLKQWVKEDCFNGRTITYNHDDYYKDNCEKLGGLGDWLSWIYTIIKFAVPILIIAMGIKDFVQALTSGKEDALKKAGSSFIKRLIMGAVFVALPILIEMILTIALGGSFANVCITI